MVEVRCEDKIIIEEVTEVEEVNIEVEENIEEEDIEVDNVTAALKIFDIIS